MLFSSHSRCSILPFQVGGRGGNLEKHKHNAKLISTHHIKNSVVLLYFWRIFCIVVKDKQKWISSYQATKKSVVFKNRQNLQFGFETGWGEFRIHPAFIEGASSILVNCPTRWSLLFRFGFLSWSSSWRLGPHIGVCRLLWPLLRAGMAVLTQFFCKMYFLYIRRERKKNLATLWGVLPLQKKVFFQSLGPARVFQKLRSPHRRYSAYFEKWYF